MKSMNSGLQTIMPSLTKDCVGKLLLLDLDGVLVTDGTGDTKIGSEIITIHKELSEQLADIKIPVAVLTHRSRGEALQIIHALGLGQFNFAAIYTANDIFISGLKFKGISFLLKNGSRKSIILSQIEKSFNISPANVAFIDDRLCNVEDLVEAGVGLGLNAPAAMVLKDQKIQAFDLVAAFEKIQVWCQQGSQTHSIVHLEPVVTMLHTKANTGIVMKRQWNDFYGLTRSCFRQGRQLFLKFITK